MHQVDVELVAHFNGNGVCSIQTTLARGKMSCDTKISLGLKEVEIILDKESMVNARRRQKCLLFFKNFNVFL